MNFNLSGNIIMSLEEKHFPLGTLYVMTEKISCNDYLKWARSKKKTKTTKNTSWSVCDRKLE